MTQEQVTKIKEIIIDLDGLIGAIEDMVGTLEDIVND